MAISIIQPSFSGGEIAPSLYGRVDLAKYATALRKCRNFIVRQYGGAENRPGTRFITATKYSDKKCRLIPFQFSTVQTYALEFGELYIRVFKDGGQVLYAAGEYEGDVFELATPYKESELFNLKFTQSADVMTIVHTDHPPMELQRYDHDDWRLVEVETKNGPFEDINTDKAIKVHASASTGTVTLTATHNIFGSEQVGKQFYLEQRAVDEVPVWETDKDTAVNDQRRAGSHYYRANTAGKTGTLRPSHTEGMSWDGWGGDNGIQWEYLHSGFGIAKIESVGGDGKTATGKVISYLPSNAVTTANASHKWARAAWNKETGYPGTVTYYQQRLFFAGSRSQPQTIWASRSGDYKDFGRSNPIQDDDRIIYTYAGRQVNEIRHLIDVGSLVALTSGGEYQVTGDQNKVLTPASFSMSSQGANGSSNLPPIAVANIALYVQEKGSAVRDLAYSFDVDGYQGTDLTILANHLFQKHQIVDWAFSTVPYSIAWCVRDDGVLLALTYLREQQVFAWAPQHTDGEFESLCTISEGAEDAVYFVVKRKIGKKTVRYVERLAGRLFTRTEDAFFVDSGLSYDGRNTDSDKTVVLTGGKDDWSYQEEYRLSVLGGEIFKETDIDNEIHIDYTEEGEQKILKCRIVDVINSKEVTVSPNRNVPYELQSVMTSGWGFARKFFTGIGHLEGKTVNVLADANAAPPVIISGERAEIDTPSVVVHIGLPITSELETLDIHINGQETLLDKKKLVKVASLIVNSSRGVWAGTDKEHLYEYPQREFEFYDNPVDDATGIVEINLDSNWSKNGRVFIRQEDPLPLSILAVIPRLDVGGF
ncbi:hypothetical protein [Morganella psychrotolerans]|uniref:Phage protein n=1 Tax=Morganella psychrotolerans TaxID=368603 RepID=A0A1B8H6X4_9GAMM|nr:hypothetical protein [Morganella psychrotolerans]OBU04838.1 hypothetical protein AYY17_08055 [Morganella psychrotolerans]